MRQDIRDKKITSLGNQSLVVWTNRDKRFYVEFDLNGSVLKILN